MVLPAASTARIVTATGTPATWGEATFEIAKWLRLLETTGKLALVIGVMPVRDWSVTVIVWLPTVRSVTWKAR